MRKETLAEKEIKKKIIEIIFEKILNEVDKVVFLKIYGDLKGKVKIDGVALTLLADQILDLFKQEKQRGWNEGFVKGKNLSAIRFLEEKQKLLKEIEKMEMVEYQGTKISAYLKKQLKK